LIQTASAVPERPEGTGVKAAGSVTAGCGSVLGSHHWYTPVFRMTTTMSGRSVVCPMTGYTPWVY
jgi:hypothetical protein